MLPFSAFVAVIVAFVSAALYVFVNAGLFPVTATTNLPCPLSVTSTFTSWEVLSYVTPPSVPSFSVRVYVCTPASVYVISSKVIVPSALFLAVPTTLAPSFSSNSNWSSFSVLPFSAFVAVIVAFVGFAV